ncbi:MAG: CDP-glycerol glycerophosphotransferase family protein [Alicyclobacillus herbarius]|uniref:CDP-glycerol glycerophosphotransferase family protein n=1 Tax=Alicyclobacillus herbarius TaxID=122960 RepID=UPI0023526D75|nr:CDP-glycerol glycerophosphotransferase family protein [Alicyclobacillus herbarius]MCL6632478.1 CDP-glycerol glycerophosphotransferase family protein [Alicyclobacillus herbarius]
MNRRGRFTRPDKQEWKLEAIHSTNRGWEVKLTPLVDDGHDYELLLKERGSNRSLSFPLERVRTKEIEPGEAYYSTEILFSASDHLDQTLFAVDTWDVYVAPRGADTRGESGPWRLRSQFRESESLYLFHRPEQLAAIPYTTVQGNFSIRIRRLNGSAKLVSAQWDGDGVLVLDGYVFGPLVDPHEPEGVRLTLVVRNELATVEYPFPATPVPWAADEAGTTLGSFGSTPTQAHGFASVSAYGAPSQDSCLAFRSRVHVGAMDMARDMDQRFQFFVSVADKEDVHLLPVRRREGGPLILAEQASVVHTRQGAVRLELLLDGLRPLMVAVPHDLEVEIETVYARDAAISLSGWVVRPAGATGEAQLWFSRRDSTAKVSLPVVLEHGRFSVRLRLDDLWSCGLREGLWDVSLAWRGKSCRLHAWQDGIQRKNERVRFPRQRVAHGNEAFAVYPLYTRGDYLAIRVRPDVRVKSVSSVELTTSGMVVRARLEILPPVEGVETVHGQMQVRCPYGEHIRLPVECSLRRVNANSNDFHAVFTTTLASQDFARLRPDLTRNLYFDSVACQLEFPRHHSRFPLTISPDAVVASFDDRLNRHTRLRRLFDKARVALYRVANSVLPVRSDLVVFQSYYGNSYACNPRAIYEEMLRQGRRFRAVWVMKDLNKSLPGEPRLVKPRSTAYFYYMARAKYFINNGNFPDFYRKRAGTVHVETWHGTPLKRLGYDVDPGSTAYAENTAPELMQRVRRWDYLVAPNAYTAEILCRAYRYEKTVLEVGYPRNDLFYRSDAEERAKEIRRRLNIPEDKRVILYAPTWRDSERKRRNTPYEFRFDVEEFKREFGGEYVLLLRLHYFDAARMQLLDDSGIVRNLTFYDDIQDLYLISDLLITDYSSVMFDFANTGRPMIFFTYDLLSYRSVMRGFYFDFEQEAPGPLVKHQRELFAAIREAGQLSERYRAKYDAFVRRFCSLEDGGAAGRVIEAVFGETGKGGRG